MYSNDMFVPAVVGWFLGDQERADSPLHRVRESRAQLALCTSFQYIEAKAERAPRLPHLLDQQLSTWIERIYKQADDACFRCYFMKQLKPLRLKRHAQPTYTRDIAAGSVHPGDEAVLHRVTAGLKNDRYHRGSRFCREARSGSADSGNHGHLAANEITRQVRQSIILPFRPAVLDRQVLALDNTAFLETLAERIQLRHRCVG